MGCRAGKVTPVSSLHSDIAGKEAGASQQSRQRRNSTINEPMGITEDVDSGSALSNRRMFQPPAASRPLPKHRHSAPVIDPFTDNTKALVGIKNNQRTNTTLDTLHVPHLIRSSSNTATTPPLSASGFSDSGPASKFQSSATAHVMSGLSVSSLRNQREASNSQIDFFKMLDKKIEEGPDLTKDDKIN